MGSQNKPVAGKGSDRAEPDPVDLADVEERRSTVRRPTFKAGEIVFTDGRSVACVVRNVSESGCLIKLENADVLPEVVEIRIDIDKPARTAEIVWRSATLAGAMFVRKVS